MSAVVSMGRSAAATVLLVCLINIIIVMSCLTFTFIFLRGEWRIRQLTSDPTQHYPKL